MVIPRKRSIITLGYKSMKLNLMELAYTEYLTAGYGAMALSGLRSWHYITILIVIITVTLLNQKHNLRVSFELYTLSRKTSLILKNVPKIFRCPF